LLVLPGGGQSNISGFLFVVDCRLCSYIFPAPVRGHCCCVLLAGIPVRGRFSQFCGGYHMKRASVVDPELAIMAQASESELSLENLPAAREFLLEMLAVPAQALSCATVSVEERHIPGEGSAPSVRVIIYRPASVAAAMPAIVEIHGGGFVMGVPEQNDWQNRQLAETLGCVVVAVNYRLAP